MSQVSSRRSVDKASFEAVDAWIKQTRSVRGDAAKIVLIGNKNDLQHERVVTMDEGYEKSKEVMASFMEVSAKRGVVCGPLHDDERRQRRTPR